MPASADSCPINAMFCIKYTIRHPTALLYGALTKKSPEAACIEAARPDQSNTLLVLGEKLCKDSAHTGILPIYEGYVRVRYLHGHDTEYPGTKSSKICFRLFYTDMHNNCNNHHTYCFGSHNFRCFMESPHQNCIACF